MLSFSIANNSDSSFNSYSSLEFLLWRERMTSPANEKTSQQYRMMRVLSDGPL